MAKVVRVADLLKAVQLEVVVEGDLQKPIGVPDVNRPALELAGYFDYYPPERVQVLGRTEMTFLERLPRSVQEERLDRLCREAALPCLILARNWPLPSPVETAASKYGVAVLRSPDNTSRLASRITEFLERVLAPEITLHGVLVDVYGLGILLTGESGVGKSETALELVKRGHRLVADDAVEIRRRDESTLEGRAPELIEHLMEIRGIGIIDVMTLFGAGAVRAHKNVEIVMQLENWREGKSYDRLGLEERTTTILDVTLPLLEIPVRPGRNLAVIVEVAAMNQRLKAIGVHAARALSQQMSEMMEREQLERNAPHPLQGGV
ncbi:MAG: HPr(Ser) kinase/phosphatase [Firmicutes bacterium]|nr:HPr(Ser) kinase/phosphatase [Bacillota bacterium]